MAVLWRRSSKARHMWLQTKLLLPPPQRGLVSRLLLKQSWLRRRRRSRDPQAAVPVSHPLPPQSSPRPCTCSTTSRGCLPSPFPHSGLCHQHIFLGWDRPQNRHTWFELLQMWIGPIYCHIFCVMSLTKKDLPRNDANNYVLWTSQIFLLPFIRVFHAVRFY